MRKACARSVLVRLQQPTAVPLGTLHGRRDEAGKTIRVTVRGVVSRESMGEFSLRPSQGDVRAIFLPLARLQTDLNQPEKVNAVLVACARAARMPRCRRMMRKHQRRRRVPSKRRWCRASSSKTLA